MFQFIDCFCPMLVSYSSIISSILIFLEYRIKMQKISRFSTNKTILPNIYGDMAKTNCRSISKKHHKQNLCTENRDNRMVSHQESINRFNRKNIVENADYGEKETKGLFFQEKQKGEVETRRKFSRPWIDQQVDLNKQTIKNNKLQSIIHKQPKNAHKTATQRKSINDKISDETILSMTKIKPLNQNQTRPIKAMSQRNDSLPKQKISQCRIAMRKGAFPINKKHYEQQKINEYFEQSISIINKNDNDQANEFISASSFLNIMI